MTPAAITLPLNPVALRLGYLALIPFVVGAALIWITQGEAHHFAMLVMSGYAAVVVSFIGAVHWGFGFHEPEPDTQLFVWGVMPALIAWIALAMQPYAGLVVHGLMLVVCYLKDRRVYPLHGAGRWLTLRFRLTAIASLCCFVGAAGN